MPFHLDRGKIGNEVARLKCSPEANPTLPPLTSPALALPYPTPTSPCSGFRLWSRRLSLIRRTAVCGPACTVVWEGSPERHPYPDFGRRFSMDVQGLRTAPPWQLSPWTAIAIARSSLWEKDPPRSLPASLALCLRELTKEENADEVLHG
jgi:hypothetical protein